MAFLCRNPSRPSSTSRWWQGYGNASEYFRTLVREAQEREEDSRLELLLLERACVGRQGHSVDDGVLRHGGTVLLLESGFNEEIDEYEDKYSVYVMPDSIEDMAKAGQWCSSPPRNMRLSVR